MPRGASYWIENPGVLYFQFTGSGWSSVHARTQQSAGDRAGKELIWSCRC